MIVVHECIETLDDAWIDLHALADTQPDGTHWRLGPRGWVADSPIAIAHAQRQSVADAIERLTDGDCFVTSALTIVRRRHQVYLDGTGEGDDRRVLLHVDHARTLAARMRDWRVPEDPRGDLSTLVHAPRPQA